MNKYYDENISLKSKLIENYCALYFASYENKNEAVNRLTKLIYDHQDLNNESFNEKYKELTKFERIFLSMDSVSIEFLMNEYIFLEKGKWYIPICSKRTYYTIKTKTINKFMNMLGGI